MCIAAHVLVNSDSRRLSRCTRNSGMCVWLLGTAAPDLPTTSSRTFIVAAAAYLQSLCRTSFNRALS